MAGPKSIRALAFSGRSSVEVPLLVDDFLRRAATVYAHKTAVVDGEHRFSYRELKTRVNQLSHALRSLDLEPGDRVCMLSPNSHFFLETFYATAQTGIILVPLNYRLVAAGFFCLFLWAWFGGQMRDVESAKYRMLELQRQIDERELERSAGSTGRG